MYGEIWAILLSVLIIVVAVFRSRTTTVSTHYCKKSEIAQLLQDISDDAVIQICVGRKKHEHKRTGNY